MSQCVAWRHGLGLCRLSQSEGARERRSCQRFTNAFIGLLLSAYDGVQHLHDHAGQFGLLDGVGIQLVDQADLLLGLHGRPLGTDLRGRRHARTKLHSGQVYHVAMFRHGFQTVPLVGLEIARCSVSLDGASLWLCLAIFFRSSEDQHSIIGVIMLGYFLGLEWAFDLDEPMSVYACNPG